MIQIVQSGVTDTTIFVLLATSFFAIFSVGKMLHFAHGTAYLLGAYIGYSVGRHAPFAVAVLCATLGAAVFGFLCETLIYRPLRARGATGMILLISSLALFIVGENVIGMKYGGEAISIQSSLQHAVVRVGGASFSWIQIIGAVGAVLWVVALALLLRRTSLGAYMRAIATHEPLAELSGVPTVRVRQAVFFGASAAVGFAGIVRMVDLNGEPTMGLTGILFAIVPFLVGGGRSLWGAVMGAALIGFGTNVFSWYVGDEWTLSFVFAVLALVMLVRPEGIVSGRSA
jgi:branched-chain amino acid transport system permease protein